MTDVNETVVNGWSSSARNGPFANSGMVVSVDAENWKHLSAHGALAGLEFQKQIEQKAFAVAGNIQAPAQRMEDFIQNKTSATLPRTSYVPGIISAELKNVLPSFITQSLREALVDFGKKMKGYRTKSPRFPLIGLLTALSVTVLVQLAQALDVPPAKLLAPAKLEPPKRGRPPKKAQPTRE
jgi:uncharacterized FAD-dependent dehydrogenase